MARGSFRLATLGCRTNQYETQLYRDQLLQLGFREAQEGEAADLCIVNTCTVTEGADRASRRHIRQLVQQNPSARVVVTGCLAGRSSAYLADMEGVVSVVSNEQKGDLIATLFPDAEPTEPFITHFEGHTRAFIKVQDGCNAFCTYCIIPYVRGRSRSRSIASVCTEITGLIEAGYKEVVITGINVGDFRDGEQGLAALLAAIDPLNGIERIRLSSIDPEQVDEALLTVMSEGLHLAPHLHLSLQSGSNAVLKRMNRRYTREAFLVLTQKIRARLPEVTFTSDVIVGFPGETEEDFEATLDLMRQVSFSKVHLFPYSKRERTRAALYPELLSPQEKEARMQRALRVAEEEADRVRASYVGRTMHILTEAGGMGHTHNFLPVQLPHYQGPANQLLSVILTANGPQGLLGEVVYD